MTRSRCLLFRIPRPARLDASNILAKIAQAEGFKISKEEIEDIVDDCARNLRQAILRLQHKFMTQNSQEAYFENWKQCIEKNIVGRRAGD